MVLLALFSWSSLHVRPCMFLLVCSTLYGVAEYLTNVTRAPAPLSLYSLPMNDQLQRFLLDNTDIRGELVRLDKSYKNTLEAHVYPDAVARLLGEFLAAAVLLSATLKFDGNISLQARSDGEIPLIVAEASSDHKLRGIVRGADLASSEDFKTLLSNGHMTITIEPKQGKRYQGIVSLEGDNLAECVESYFRQSEQLSTRVWLSSNGEKVAGMMLQQLPSISSSQIEARQRDWEHATHLANTLTSQELLCLDFSELLYRLYNQEQVRLFDPANIEFSCHCSRDRTLSALMTVGEKDLLEIINEQGSIETDCEFCHQHYQFSDKDIKSLFEHALH
jgi:molecular chaperone Hsp33